MTDEKKIVKFKTVSKILPVNMEAVEMLEELLDLAKCGSLQCLSYCYVTQDGDQDSDIIIGDSSYGDYMEILIGRQWWRSMYDAEIDDEGE